MTKAKSPTHAVPFRRRREGKTNFQKRLGMVKSGKTRLVVRRSNRYVDVYFVNFELNGDKTLLSVTGKKLSKEFQYPAKRNTWSAYLAGLYAGRLAQSAGVKEFILDTGMYTVSKGSILFAALKGAVDSGMNTNYKEEMVPNDKLDNPLDKSAFDEAKKRIMG